LLSSKEKELLVTARTFFQDTLAEFKDTHPQFGEFLRYVWSRSQGEMDYVVWRKRWVQERGKVFPVSNIRKVAEISSKLVRALELANAAYTPPKHSQRTPLYTYEALQHVREIREESHLTLDTCNPKIRKGRPTAVRRLYFVPALLPYMKWAHVIPRAKADEPDDRGIWAWLTRWEAKMEPIHVFDMDWLSKKLRTGGLLPEDFADESRFLVHSPGKGSDHNSSLFNWWSGVRGMHSSEIIDYGAAFLTWQRKFGNGKGGRIDTASLPNKKKTFIESAAETLAIHCGVKEAYIKRRWGSKNLVRRGRNK
jgi:hypothetical protein